MRLRNKKTGQEGNFIINEDHFECTDLEYVPEYRSLAELNEEWEDYKPKEPLITDEKIRKAVRAWAEVNSIKEALYAVRTDGRLCVLTDMSDDDFSIELVGWIPTLKDGESYTIAELCGEEEE